MEQGAARQAGTIDTSRARRSDASAPPGLGEVEKTPDAPRFGTVGRLDYDAFIDAPCCEVCGEWKRNLAQHARLAHRLSADAYRALASLHRTTTLVTPTIRARLREVSVPLIERLRAEGRLRRWDEDREKFRRDKAAAVDAIRQGPRPEGRRRRSEAFTTVDERRARAERGRQRNLARLDRVTPAAIAAGIRRPASPSHGPARDREGAVTEAELRALIRWPPAEPEQQPFVRSRTLEGERTQPRLGRRNLTPWPTG